MRTITLVLLLLSGCSTLNILSGPDDFCRSMSADLGLLGLDDAIARELRQEPPQGALTKPYSRAEWDVYWNHRIYYVWSAGPNDCNGTYKGPPGSDLIRNALQRRRELGLPDIQLEERNRAKELSA